MQHTGNTQCWIAWALLLLFIALPTKQPTTDCCADEQQSSTGVVLDQHDHLSALSASQHQRHLSENCTDCACCWLRVPVLTLSTLALLPHTYGERFGEEPLELRAIPARGIFKPPRAAS